MRIKKGDQIQVIAGKSKGKKGKVTRVLPASGKIVAEKINVMKKHMKPKREGEKGQIVEVDAPFDVSNAMLVCPECGKMTRVGYSVKNGNKSRVCKKCKKEF
ncbi:MAG: ribosomal protein L24 [uncultured bacterium]|nr:MAG: ribosomal protein L24 [uncultured bacterium]KKT88678.1 MAG: 50S ribosomal protein L24 [Candidatus Moranbacteria bacterium GW2011_GWC2_45_10]KKT95317.1 MAG: 50S ribosomal protein L24 [Parcubacteria group bacterium GW2011_GWC1_45_14]HAV11007.1 50S ribosomal protein L24 [Candidatus Moranbacteria bacterium]